MTTSTGTTEAIWHFLGYLHLIENAAKAHAEISGYTHPHHTGVFDPSNPAAGPPPAPPDELDSRPVRDDLFDHAPIAFHQDISGLAQLTVPLRIHPMQFEDPDAVPRPPLVAGNVSPASIHRLADVEQEPGGDQLLIEIRQHNFAEDRDEYAGGHEYEILRDDAPQVASLAEMTETARDFVADHGFPAGAHGTELVQYVQSFDYGPPSTGEEVTPLSAAQPNLLQPGLTINGELMPEGSTADALYREHLPLPEMKNGGPDGEAGQIISMGSNNVYNGAVIQDYHEASLSKIVLGDHYSLNAIIQLNVLSDNDDVGLAGEVGFRDLVTGDNATNNIAEYLADTIGVTGGGRSGRSWHVDTVDGDYYDVRSLLQRNYLSDQDIVVQTSSQNYSTIVTGGNEQVNLGDVGDLFSRYDLIIIGGNYYQANIIQQINILQDDDVVRMAIGAAGDDGSQTLIAGHNSLTNTALIAQYEPGLIEDLSSELNDFARSLWDATSIDPTPWWDANGLGSAAMNVLYITGNYFDINYISQTNIVGDWDFATLLPPASSGGYTQYVSTGDNILENFAGILDVGSPQEFLGGDYYESSILIQANLLPEESDKIQFGDTETLVSEIIAFTDGTVLGGEPEASSPVQQPIHQDGFAHVLA